MRTRKKFKKIRILTRKHSKDVEKSKNLKKKLEKPCKNKTNKINNNIKKNTTRKNIIEYDNNNNIKKITTRKNIIEYDNNNNLCKKKNLEKNTYFNFDNTFLCRWCGSNIHNTNKCSLN
tara:strand:- start:136 stop:492 length:357 start_codon:yes stop_codon:yes gene_type:complete